MAAKDEKLIEYIRRVRAGVGGIPVSTAEPWHIWHKHPELVADRILQYLERVLPGLRQHVVTRRWFTPAPCSNSQSGSNAPPAPSTSSPAR